MPRSLRTLVHGIAVGLLVLFLLPFAQRNLIHQGDLRTYLAAARCASLGMDPYSPDQLQTVARRRVFPFVYPTVTLLPFGALSTLPPRTAAAVWMYGKLVLLALLVLLWWRRFVPGVGVLPLALVAVFGWNESALWDLSAGNIAIVEAALLWAGFACYLEGRRGAFAALVVAASCFKLAPAAFLVLLLAPDREGKTHVRTFAIALAGLAILVGLPLAIGPAAHWERFWRHVPDASAYGDANPSALALAIAAFARLRATARIGLGLPVLLYAAFAVLLCAASAGFVRRAWQDRDHRRLVMAGVLLYVLLSPRPMAYGFVLLAPALFFFAPRPFRGPAGALLLALLLCAQGFSRAVSIQSASLLFGFASFLLTLCLWLLVLVQESRGDAPQRA